MNPWAGLADAEAVVEEVADAAAVDVALPAPQVQRAQPEHPPRAAEGEVVDAVPVEAPRFPRK